MKIKLLILFLFITSNRANAQDDLFGEKKTTTNKGFIIGVNFHLDFPSADMAKRFGNSIRVGPSIQYKTTNNYFIGFSWDFLNGGNIKEDSLLCNITDASGQVLNQAGQKIGLSVLERGYTTGLQFGKLFNVSKHNGDNGILWMNTLGFIQHKINIYNKDNAVPQLKSDYLKGYDRLANGWFIEEYLGYSVFSKNELINFHVGVSCLLGFTQGRRDYWYDVMRPGNEKRTDVLMGIHLGWYIPIFHRENTEFSFE
jgi:hypothetical protein